jgi:glycosyltransferase involved in cell wall biosynthesis
LSFRVLPGNAISDQLRVAQVRYETAICDGFVNSEDRDVNRGHRAKRAAEAPLTQASHVAFLEHKGVHITVVRGHHDLRAQLRSQIISSAPSVVIVSSEDPFQSLLKVALDMATPISVYIAHTTSFAPFGPSSFDVDPTRANWIRQCAAVFTVSDYLREYFKKWGGIDAIKLPLPVYGVAPFPVFGRHRGGCITMVNPCAVKGLSLFIELAQAFRDVPFAAVPTWGTTADDLDALSRLPNMRILPASECIDDIFAVTTVLVVPSLWQEAFGLIVVEAMLRGIPVLASDVGGLREAKLGVDYVLQVRPIEKFLSTLDSKMIPRCHPPTQDVTPWIAALRLLLTDEHKYVELADRSREAAIAFVTRLDISDVEKMLRRISGE